MHTPLTANEMWTAVTKNDARYDARFVYAVQSTGIFCRPSCTSRDPKPENVRYFDTPDAALD
ncbi:MAG: Ada metal-binding domain-containing protein, partial [Chloroflexota bacterium]